MDFYRSHEGKHVVRAPYVTGGLERELFYVDVPVQFKGDPDTGMDLYESARRLASFEEGSLDTTLEEFTYLHGFIVLESTGQ